jgi:DUF971 family protein
MDTTGDDIALRERLTAPDATVRRIALLGLSNWSGDENVDLFIDALRDTDATVRAEAARVLEGFASQRLPAAKPLRSQQTSRVENLRMIGSYGLQLVFGDRHERGIYPWPYLRSLPADNQ